jgi:iron complex outermembrane receptor protein
VTTSLSLFYNDYSHLRSTTPTPATIFPIYFQNNLEGETYGLELSTDYQMLDWWRWNVGYDFLKEHIHVVPGQIDFTHGLNETADPENQIFLRSSMDLTKDVAFDVNGRWIDSLRISDGDVAATVPGYFEVDARLGWHVNKNLEISVVGQNLLHDQHAEYGFPGPEQAQIERSVYGKITWHF